MTERLWKCCSIRLIVTASLNNIALPHKMYCSIQCCSKTRLEINTLNKYGITCTVNKLNFSCTWNSQIWREKLYQKCNVSLRDPFSDITASHLKLFLMYLVRFTYVSHTKRTGNRTYQFTDQDEVVLWKSLTSRIISLGT